MGEKAHERKQRKICRQRGSGEWKKDGTKPNKENEVGREMKEKPDDLEAVPLWCCFHYYTPGRPTVPKAEATVDLHLP
jgi:hypothetical protein